MIHELLSIRTADEDLTHVGHIEHSGLMADSIVFVSNVCVLNRHDETSERAHQSAQGHMLVIKTGFQKILFHMSIYLIFLFNLFYCRHLTRSQGDFSICKP